MCERAARNETAPSGRVDSGSFVAGQPFIAPTSAIDRRRLGKFEVLCRLSTGGMSQIYLATQSGIGGFKKLVVLKTILPDIGGEEDFVRMFLDEARTTAAFNHPNIAQVFELDVDGGELFMAMEFVQGCTLVEMARACRTAKQPIPIGFTLQSVRDTALALHYAHNFTDARGRKQIVIHRDVAEKNIMVTYEGVTKLLDFGIAKALGRSGHTSVGMVKGTSGYMSPEQIRGEPLDPRSDVFALGVVAHECLTGLRLFHGRSPEDGMRAALETTVAPPSKTNPQVTAEIDAVVMKALQRRRDDRYATALEFGRAIEKAAPGVIWHPEQTAELVTQHFSERRAETRRLLEATSFGAESTGEIRIDSLLARVKASAPTVESSRAPPSVAATPPPPVTTPPVPPPSKPMRAPPPATVLPPENETNPARPRLLRPGPQALVESSVPFGATQLPILTQAPRAASTFHDDEDSEAKTLPAAVLPEEIKALRARMLANKASAKAASESQASVALRQVGSSTILEVAPASPTEARRASAGQLKSPIPPALEPPRTMTGETMSVTGRAEGPRFKALEDDEPEAKTAVGLPFATRRLDARKPSVFTESPPGIERDDDDDDDDPRPRGRSPAVAMLLLVPLLLAAVAAVLYATGLPPFETTGTSTPTREAIEPRSPPPAG